MKNKIINNPKIGTIVRHTGWGKEKNKNYPCDVLITSGQLFSNGRLSNFWSWKRITSTGKLSKTEHGYGSFVKKIKKYKITTSIKIIKK